jgi:glycosidase
VQAKHGAVHIEIPAEAKSMERSFIRVFAHNGKLRSNDVLVPLTHGDVVMNSSSLNRHDKQGDIMYFMMVDRFVDGDSTNNRPTLDPSILPKANNFGGDLVGITQKIKDGYFKSLGINTIWVSPISQNAEGAWGLWDKGVVSKFSAYHGYWPTSLQQIDNRFGTEAQFKELIQVAHDNNMNVVLDYVAHHVHQDHPLHKMKPDWSTSLYLPDGTMNTEKWDEHRLTTWFDTFLPTWDFSKAEVVSALTDTAMFWVKNYELDGFRHDATKHIPVEFWQTLTYKVKKELENKPSRHVFQIGETYGNPQLIGSYISSGQLDAQFDFNLYDAAVDAFAKDETSFTNLKRVMNQSLDAYGSHHLMGNITGNQDRARFASYADGSVKFSEDPKLAGWTRDIQNQGDSGFEKMAWLNAFIMTVPGIPCIYYGDEIAMPGANDPDNRRMMHFTDWNTNQKALRDEVALLTQFRNTHLAMTYGDLVILEETDDALVYARNYFGQTAVVVFSKKPGAEITFTLPESLNASNMKSLKTSELKQNGNTFTVKLAKGKGYDILYN